MKVSTRSVVFIIVSIYATVILFANNYFCSLINLDKYQNYLLIIAPSSLILSLIIDFIKEKGKLKNINLFIGIAFLLWGIISIILGIHTSIINLKAFINLSIITLLGILLYNSIINKEQFNDIKKHLFIALGIVVIIGIFQYIFDIGLTNKMDSMKYIGINGRVISTYHIATVLDKFLIMIIAVLSFELLKKKSYFLSILFILSSVTLALTFTRAGIIAFIALCIFFITTSVWQKRYFNILIVIISILTMFNISGYKYAFQSAADYVYNTLKIPSFLQLTIIDREKLKEENIPDITEDESIVYRDYYQFVGTSIIKEYPVSGIGIGNYTYLYEKQNINDYLKNKIELKDKYMYPHNGFIQTIAELGIIGIILYLLFFGSMLLKKMNKKDLINLYPCVLLLFFFLLGTYTEGLFTTKQYMYIFMIIYPIYCSYQLKKDS